MLTRGGWVGWLAESPKGFRPKAQGWRARLPWEDRPKTNAEGVYVMGANIKGRNHVVVDEILDVNPG